MRPSRLNRSPMGFALPSLNRSITISSMNASVADPVVGATYRERERASCRLALAHPNVVDALHPYADWRNQSLDLDRPSEPIRFKPPVDLNESRLDNFLLCGFFDSGFDPVSRHCQVSTGNLTGHANPVVVWHPFVVIEQSFDRAAVTLLYRQLITDDIAGLFRENRVRISLQVNGPSAFIFRGVRRSAKTNPWNHANQPGGSDPSDVAESHIKNPSTPA